MAWTADELARIEGATELRLASRRRDGTLRPFVRIWVVRAGDDVYVRSAYGHDNGWFRRAQASGVADVIDAAYHAKYDRYGPRIVGTVVSPEAARSTLRLIPR